MAGPADQTAAASAIGTTDLNHDTARRSRTDQLMRVMAGGTLHFSTCQQCFTDGLASQAGAVPRGRNWRGIDCEEGLGIANVVGCRILQLTIGGSQRRVIGKRDRMSSMQVRPDLE